MTKKIILFLYLIFPLVLFSQKSDSITLLNNKIVHLSPLNEEIHYKITRVKVSKVRFKGKVEGYGRANAIRIVGLNDFLRKNRLKPIRKISCSNYVKQGDNTPYIRAYTCYNGKKESVFNGRLYEITTEQTKYTFIIMN